MIHKAISIIGLMLICNIAFAEIGERHYIFNEPYTEKIDIDFEFIPGRIYHIDLIKIFAPPLAREMEQEGLREIEVKYISPDDKEIIFSDAEPLKKEYLTEKEILQEILDIMKGKR